MMADEVKGPIQLATFDIVALTYVLAVLVLGIIALVRADSKDIPSVVRELAKWWWHFRR